MATVTAGNSATFEIGPFDTITLNDANALGTLVLTSQTPKLVSDKTLGVQNGTFGPWGAPMSVTLTVQQGAVDYTVNIKSLNATNAAVAASLVSGALKRASTVGDSISDSGIYQFGQAELGTGSDLRSDAGWFNTALQLSGHRLLHWSHHAVPGARMLVPGVSGQRSMHLQIDDAIAAGTDSVHMMAGENDSGLTISEIISAYTTLIEKVLGAGKELWCYTTPISTTSSVSQGKLFQLRRWLMQHATTIYSSARFVVVDTAGAVLDPLVSPSNWKPSTTLDRTHPINNGAVYMAEEAARVMMARLPEFEVRPVSHADNLATDSNSRQLFPNTLLANAVTTPANARYVGGVGEIVGGFSVTDTSLPAASVTSSRVARADGYGYDQQFVVASTANGQQLNFYINTPLVVTGGDIVQGEMEIAIAAPGALKTAAVIMYTQAPGLQASVGLDTAGVYPNAIMVKANTFRRRTPRMLIQPGKTGCEFQCLMTFGGAGTTTIRIGRPWVVKHYA